MTITEFPAPPHAAESIPLSALRPGLAARFAAGITTAAERNGIELIDLQITQPPDPASMTEFPVSVRIVGTASPSTLTASVTEGIAVADVSDVLADDPPLALAVTAVSSREEQP